MLVYTTHTLRKSHLHCFCFIINSAFTIPYHSSNGRPSPSHHLFNNCRIVAPIKSMTSTGQQSLGKHNTTIIHCINLAHWFSLSEHTHDSKIILYLNQQRLNLKQFTINQSHLSPPLLIRLHSETPPNENTGGCFMKRKRNKGLHSSCL